MNEIFYCKHIRGPVVTVPHMIFLLPDLETITVGVHVNGSIFNTKTKQLNTDERRRGLHVHNNWPLKYTTPQSSLHMTNDIYTLQFKKPVN